jgi:hypothetical protein
MRIVGQIQREVQGVLRLDELNVLGEETVFEFEYLVIRRILVELAANSQMNLYQSEIAVSSFSGVAMALTEIPAVRSPLIRCR